MKRGSRTVAILCMLLLAGMSLDAGWVLAEHRAPSGKEKVVIIAGGAAGGAALGGLLGGRRGALAGAIAGGSGGAIYDHARRTQAHPRAGKDKLVLIGGSTAAGASAGGIAGGAKGALIGGAIGAAGGYILERKTKRDRDR